VFQYDKKVTILDIACGEGHSLILQNNLQLLACGTNTFG
jgi:alpha-tubulin suppressor-like RCC1 family protein